MKKIIALSALTGLLAVGCSSSDSDMGGTYDSTGGTWSDHHTSSSAPHGDAVPESSTMTDTSGSGRMEQNQDMNLDTPNSTTNASQSGTSELKSSSGAASTPGNSDAGRDSSTGNSNNNSNTNDLSNSSSGLQPTPPQ